MNDSRNVKDIELAEEGDAPLVRADPRTLMHQTQMEEREPSLRLLERRYMMHRQIDLGLNE